MNIAFLIFNLLIILFITYFVLVTYYIEGPKSKYHKSYSEQMRGLLYALMIPFLFLIVVYFLIYYVCIKLGYFSYAKGFSDVFEIIKNKKELTSFLLSTLVTIITVAVSITTFFDKDGSLHKYKNNVSTFTTYLIISSSLLITLYTGIKTFFGFDGSMKYFKHLKFLIYGSLPIIALLAIGLALQYYPSFSDFIASKKLSTGFILLVLAEIAMTLGILYTIYSCFSADQKSNLMNLLLLGLPIMVCAIAVILMIHYPKITNFKEYSGFIGLSTFQLAVLSVLLYYVYNYFRKGVIHTGSMKLYKGVLSGFQVIPDTFNYIYNNLKDTPSSELTFLGVLIAIIVGYVLFPMLKTKFLSKLYYHNALHKLENPLYMNKTRTIITSDELSRFGEFKNKYAISAEIYIDSLGSNKINQNDSMNGYTIMSYGDSVKVNYDSNEKTLNFYYIDEKNDTILLHSEKNIPMQKWHSILINSRNGTIDIFINKKLVSTKSGLIDNSHINNLVMGNPNVYGGIKDVTFYPYSLNSTEIMFT